MSSWDRQGQLIIGEGVLSCASKIVYDNSNLKELRVLSNVSELGLWEGKLCVPGVLVDNIIVTHVVSSHANFLEQEFMWEKSSFPTRFVACVAGVERGRGQGIGRKGKRGGGLGRGRGDACSKNPLLFISADAGICKFLIGWAVMSNILKCTFHKSTNSRDGSGRRGCRRECFERCEFI